MTPAVFTAAQIAAALGSSRQLVQRALAAVRADGSAIVRGNEAGAWSLTSLPEAMQRKLARRARAMGCRNSEHLLSAPTLRFEAPIPVNQLAAPIQQKAMKLRDALAAPLKRHGEGLKGAALDDLGVSEYQRVFGFDISARHFRNLFQRTLARDAGEEHFERLDLYLDGRPRVVRERTATKAFSGVRAAEEILLGYAGQVRDPSKPTPEEKAVLWIHAFEQMSELNEQGMTSRTARQAMRRALHQCGVTLAKNETSLAQLWRVKEDAWRKSGGAIYALKDKRADSHGRLTAPELPQADLDIIIGRAVALGGRVSQAWREALENRLLSEPTLARYEGAYYASKSHVPRSIRDAVTPEVRMLRAIHHGPREAELRGAYISRDWSNVAAGDWYCADDWTFNAYVIAPDNFGQLSLIRPQVLLMIDTRSTCVIGFAVIDSRNYNAHAIRTLITKVCDDHGLPRKGFYFENGIWKTARLLKGDRSVSDEELTWTESEGGLRELGLDFRHARTPRAKPVERVIGAIQNLMDGMAGDAGRDEMHDKFERLQQRKRLVESGAAPADKFFYRSEQLDGLLERYCAQYNNARNDGTMTCGRTPAQAWEHFQSTPRVRLPREARYLLSSHKRPVVVGRNGITLRFGKQSFVYRNEETGKLIGHRVLAWFNPELPDVLSVTDMNRENCFTVERSSEVPAMDAPPEILAREMSLIEAHNGYARARYRTLARLADLNPRPTIMDAETASLGTTIEQQQQEVLAGRGARRKRQRAGSAAMNALGLPVRRGDDFDQEQIEAADRLKRQLEEFSEENPK